MNVRGFNPIMDFEQLAKHQWQNFNSDATATNWIQQLREQSFNHFQNQGWPHTKIENWKYTKLDLLTTQFNTKPIRFAPSSDFLDLDPDFLKKLTPDFACYHFMTLNGYLQKIATIPPLPAGARVTYLNSLAPQDQTTATKILTDAVLKNLNLANHPFAALNMSFLENVLVIELDEGVILDKPIVMTHAFLGEKNYTLTTLPQLHVICQEKSAAQLIERFVPLSTDVTFNNRLMNIQLHPHAHLRHYQWIESLAKNINLLMMISGVHVQQAAHSHYANHNHWHDATFIRQDLCVSLNGEYTHTLLNGFYHAIEKQRIDNHTVIHHFQPHGTSVEQYKGIVNDSAHAIFNGKAIVYRNAQKTNASQLNKNLLLSKRAAVDTKPELEIYADDVKCTHGATVGQLDEEALFYLRTRGLGEQDAKQLLQFAFAQDIVHTIDFLPMREHLKQHLLARLNLQNAWEDFNE